MLTNLIKSGNDKQDTKSFLNELLLLIDNPVVPHKSKYQKNMKILSKNITKFLTMLSEKTNKYPNQFQLLEDGELTLMFEDVGSPITHAIELIFDIEQGDKEYFYGVNLQIGDGFDRWQRDETKYPFLKSPVKYNFISDELIKYIDTKIKY